MMIPVEHISTIWFDLDATLYSPDTGLWAQIGIRIEDYMQNIMGYPQDQIRDIKLDYYRKYGTTLRGLQLHEQVDATHYLNYVHDIPVGNYLKPDLELKQMLLKLPQKKWIFTNSDAPHVRRVLQALEIEDCFDGWITVESINYLCKPSGDAYLLAQEISGEPVARKILFLDDSSLNLAGAKAAGHYTILVGSPNFDESADLSIRRPHELLDVLPGLARKGA